MVRLGDRELDTAVAAGHVTDRSARLWVRVPEPGLYTLEIAAIDTEWASHVTVEVTDDGGDCTAAWTYPDDLAGRSLLPQCAYQVRLFRSSAVLGQAQFVTAPAGTEDAPARWTFAALSCHQPFSRSGELHREGILMLEAANQTLRDNQAKLVLMMGDQIYADYPPRMSLFYDQYFRTVAPPGRSSILECTRAEVRSIYQQRHRQFWVLPPFLNLQSSFACYPILDDHEVVDNFGTHPDHATSAWENLRQGALDAYYDYQAQRVLRPDPHGRRPSELGYGFRWGQAAFYVLDVRSHRRTYDHKTEPYTDQQLAQFRTFLARNADCALLSLVTTIPLIYMERRTTILLTQLLSEGSDIHERWSHPSCIEHRNRLLRVLHEHARAHPHQQILLLGGDVHAGGAYEITFSDGPVMYQLVSSAISNSENIILNKVCEMAASGADGIEVNGGQAEVHLLPGQAAELSHNPFAGLNLGLVDVIDRGSAGLAINLRLVSYTNDGLPRTVFESGELLASGLGRQARQSAQIH